MTDATTMNTPTMTAASTSILATGQTPATIDSVTMSLKKSDEKILPSFASGPAQSIPLPIKLSPAPIPYIQCTLTGELCFKLEQHKDTQGGGDRQQKTVQLTFDGPLQCTLMGPIQCRQYSYTTPCDLKGPLEFTLCGSDLESLNHFYSSIIRYKRRLSPTDPLRCSIPDNITCRLHGPLICSTHDRQLQPAITSTSHIYHAKEGLFVHHALSGCTCEHYNHDPYKKSHATIKPRLLYNPENEEGQSKQFENYFTKGVKEANIPKKCWVDHLQNLKTIPRIDDIKSKDAPRTRCQPDAVFVCGMKGAVVDMKDYASPMNKKQVRKTYFDLWALAITVGCWPEKGYLYVRKGTQVKKEVEVFANKHRIDIVREEDIDADELATLVCTKLRTGTDIPHHCCTCTVSLSDSNHRTIQFYPPGIPSDDGKPGDEGKTSDRDEPDEETEKAMEFCLNKYDEKDILMTPEEIKRWEDIIKHHSELSITPTPRDPTVFIFTKD